MARKIFALLVAIAFIYIASPFIFPIAMGGVLAVLFWPWQEKLEKKNIPRILGSATLTLGITLVLLLPTSMILFLGAKTAFRQVQVWKDSLGTGDGILEHWVSSSKVQTVVFWVTGHAPISTSELATTARDLAGSFGAKVAELLGGMLTHLPGFVMALAIVVVSVYFFLVDGRRLMLFLRRNSIFSPKETDCLLDAIREMCRSVILASIVSGGIQATLEFSVCVLTGVPNAALIGLLVLVASFIPVAGALPVTTTVALHQLFIGNQGVGIVLLIMVFVIFGIDNTVRPLFLKGSTNLHPFIGFIAAFGGLQMLGFLGIFLGPIVAALFVVTVQLLFNEEEPLTDSPSSLQND